jgi:predicted nucleic acid-binding protein
MLRMPKKRIVINTSPIIALFSAFDNLNFLNKLYSEIIVPYEVKNELLHDDLRHFAANSFSKSEVFTIIEKPLPIMPILLKSLDIGEASVIQTAINSGIEIVCIDEVSGRRIARLSDLKVTGSLGIVIKAIKEGSDIKIEEVIDKMKKNGIWLSASLEKEALRLLSHISS